MFCQVGTWNFWKYGNAIGDHLHLTIKRRELQSITLFHSKNWYPSFLHRRVKLLFSKTINHTTTLQTGTNYPNEGSGAFWSSKKMEKNLPFQKKKLVPSKMENDRILRRIERFERETIIHIDKITKARLSLFRGEDGNPALRIDPV